MGCKHVFQTFFIPVRELYAAKQGRREGGQGGGLISPGPEVLGAPRNLKLGPSHFCGRNISVFGPKYLCFGGRGSKFGIKIEGKSHESNYNVFFRKIFLPKKLSTGGGV